VNLHQLRFVREAVRQNLNLTAAAKSLYTSQPGISKAILELEDELGIEIFARHGKRLRTVTAQGKLVVAAAERIMHEVEALKRVRLDHASQGELIVATTHTLARYWLAQAIAQLHARFPKMTISVMPGTPAQTAEMARNGSADLALTTDETPDDDVLTTIACVRFSPVAIVTATHPLARQTSVRFADISHDALVVEDDIFGQGEMFPPAKLKPEVAVRACDAETVKTCVALGIGVGIVADLAFHPQRDRGLRALPIVDAQTRTACVALRRDAFARRSMQALVELLAATQSKEQSSVPHVTERIEQMTGTGNVTPLRRPLPASSTPSSMPCAAPERTPQPLR